jgi:general secretion pathway protein J
MHCNHRSAAPRGFTLIELLVAITILAIVAVLGWRGLDGIVRARCLNAEMAQTRGIQLAFAQIENDCAHLMDANLLQGRSVLRAAGSKLMLIRSVLEDNQPLRFQVIVYSVVDGKLGRRELIPTREIAALENDWQSAAADTDVTPVIQLQTDVTSLAMRTWTQGETGWRIDGTDIQNAATDGAAKNPAIKSAKLAGLEVSMQVQGREAPMTKVFLLGAS